MYDVYSSEIRNKLKDIFRQTNSKFDESKLEKDWKDCYSDVRASAEYERMVNVVGGWAREMIYYFIDKHKS